ncbi:MAG: YggS family pyridoxal phosphate-dependent enzyme [Alphaproteobacteria bacterium]|nr:YggS family pyridoxal phosphate-dependent enzyme [Alphaproteobacteria bacterium]
MSNLNEVYQNIEKACQDSQRQSKDVTLVAVSKTYGIDAIEPFILEGQKTFGENRVQEAVEKFIPLKEKYPDLKLHLIGPLQTNKVKDAVALFDVIESVDRLELAEKLAKEMKKQGKNIPCFIQVNTGKEPQKSGCFPEDVEKFTQSCLDLGLNVIGLMCIPPKDEEPSAHFAFLKKLAKKVNLHELSMGMSADYTIAVEQGATFVRVGSALFGPRG